MANIVMNENNLDIAYIKLKDLVLDNFDVKFNKCSTGGEVAILDDLIKENTILPDLPMYHEVWLHISKSTVRNNADLFSLNLRFKGGLTYYEGESLPIKYYPLGPLLMGGLTMNYKIPGVDDSGVTMRYMDLSFMWKDGVDIILSGKRDKDIIAVLNASYSRYMSQLDRINK